MIRRFVPVYLITGFLESGKTTLGLTILGNERFTNGGKVLVLCCEEGETERTGACASGVRSGCSGRGGLCRFYFRNH